MRKAAAASEKPALDLIEETVALLRRCPPTVAILYYVGTVPFVLGFLYFWTDMSRGAFAREHLVESSLFVALEFVWCKCWQALFAAHLLAVASHRTLPPWRWRSLLRVATAQATIQGTGLFVLPVAALITVPLGFAYAFYQNVTVLVLDGAGEPQDGPALRTEAFAQARRWPAQNHMGLAVLSFFGLAVFANILILILTLPWLFKTMLGIETMFSRSLWSMFNTTLFAAAVGITYLFVDPILKAFFTLRCFHGRSLATGEDLQVELRASSRHRVRAVAAILCVLCAGVACGAQPPAGAPARSGEIDQSITDVLNRPEFAWREPRDAARADEKGLVGNFMDGVSRMLRRWMKPFKRWIKDFVEWLSARMRHRSDEESTGGYGDLTRASLHFLAWSFCVLAVCAMGVMGWKLWLRRGKPVPVLAQAQNVPLDLAAEDVAADQMPEDAWLGLAREMIERGDLRLALRALYLAALAHLSERQIISIARYKSNREYQRELRRRRPAQDELITTFGETVAAFERAWYGMHEVTWEIVNASQVNLERIRQA